MAILKPITGSRSELELFAKKVLILAAVIFALWLLWEARGVLVLVFIAAILAAGIAPAVWRVRLLWRFHFRKPLARGPAVMIVYLPFLAAVLLIGLLIVPRFVADMRELGQRLPELIEANVLGPLEAYVPVGFVREQLANGVELPRSRVFAYMRNAATALASVVAVLFMVAYMLIDADRLRNLFLLIYDPEVRGDRRRVLNRMAGRMSSWLAAQLFLSAIIGVTSFIGFTILQLPYALPLAILAAVGELIPMIGPTVGALPALAVAMLHARWQFWAVLIFAFVLQKLENYLIVPRVMSHSMQISPLAVFVAFMIGASLLGVIGALIAIPVAAIAQVAFDEAFVQRRERRMDTERSGTLLRKAD
jgi:predicted PurR-regulated permease PerM